MNKQIILWYSLLVFSFIAAPILPGIINKVKAFFAGRKGPSVFQLYYDLAKLVKKEGVTSASSGFPFPFAPYISLVCLILAALLVPYGLVATPLGFTGDVILFFYLMGTARMAIALGALDTGSSFEGMGSSRELQFSTLAECAIFAIIAFLVILTSRADLNLLVFAHPIGGEHTVSVILIAISLFIVLLTENCRVPADDPDTHLELTMIHEAMVLDYAGPDLAAILYGASLKLWLFASFLCCLLLPGNMLLCWTGIVLFIVGILVITILIGVVESCMARYRFLKVPQMLAGALGIALLGFFFLKYFEGA